MSFLYDDYHRQRTIKTRDIIFNFYSLSIYDFSSRKSIFKENKIEKSDPISFLNYKKKEENRGKSGEKLYEASTIEQRNKSKNKDAPVSTIYVKSDRGRGRKKPL